MGLGRVKTLCGKGLVLGGAATRAEFSGLTMLGSRHRRPDAHDVHYPGEVVGEHVERHLGGSPAQTPDQDVRRTVIILSVPKGSVTCGYCHFGMIRTP